MDMDTLSREVEVCIYLTYLYIDYILNVGKLGKLFTYLEHVSIPQSDTDTMFNLEVYLRASMSQYSIHLNMNYMRLMSVGTRTCVKGHQYMIDNIFRYKYIFHI